MTHHIEEMIQRRQIDRAGIEVRDAIIAQANRGPSRWDRDDPSVPAKALIQ